MAEPTKPRKTRTTDRRRRTGDKTTAPGVEPNSQGVEPTRAAASKSTAKPAAKRSAPARKKPAPRKDAAKAPVKPARGGSRAAARSDTQVRRGAAEMPGALSLMMGRVALWWQVQRDRLRRIRGPAWMPAHRTVPGPRLFPLAGSLIRRGRERHAAAADGAERREGTGHRPWIWWLLALGLLLLGAGAAALLYITRAQPEPQPPAPDAPYVETTAARLTDAPIIIVGNGTVSPRAEVALAAQVGGRVVEVSPRLQSGASVERGQMLFRLDPADYRNQVEQARADVAQREVELQQARQEQQIAEEEYRRLRDRLGRDPLAGDTDFDVAGRRDPGQLAGESDGPAVSPLALRRPQVRAAEAALQAARAGLADAELALQRTVVTAPFDGRVRAEDVSLGQFIQPGQEVATLYSDDMAEVAVPLSDDRAALIPGLWDAGDAARAEAAVIIDYGGRRYGWPGYVDRARGAIDQRSRTVDVVVRVPDPFQPGEPVPPEEGGEPPPPGDTASPLLLIGSFATVRIEGKGPERYLEVPTDAIRADSNLWVLTEAEQEGRSRLRMVPVAIVQRRDDVSYVTADLPDGALIITNTLQTVTDGMLVRTRVEQSGNTASPQDKQKGQQESGQESGGDAGSGSDAGGG